MRFVPVKPATIVTAAVVVAALTAAVPARAQASAFFRFSSAANFRDSMREDFDTLPHGQVTDDQGTAVTSRSFAGVSDGGRNYGFTVSTEPDRFGLENSLFVARDPQSSADMIMTTYYNGQSLVFDFAASPTPVAAFGATLSLSDYLGVLYGGHPTMDFMRITVEDAAGRTAEWQYFFDTPPATFASAPFFGVATASSASGGSTRFTPLRRVTMSLEFMTNDGYYINASDVFVGSAGPDIPEPGALSLIAGAALPTLTAAARLRRTRRATQP